MDARTYEKRRNELVGLIDKALALGTIPAKTGNALKAVRRKVYENQFRIVLVSGFECGKSTTFNMLCDGREVSPRGLMIPTSATVISAQNTLDESLDGTAGVVWRSDRDLTAIFAKSLLRYFKELEPIRFANVNQSEQLCDALKYPDDLPLLKNVVSKRMRDAQLPANIETAERNELLMAHLIAEHYDSDWIKAQKSRKDFTVENISQMICFPDDMHRDWFGKRKCAFKAEECAFVFVRQVHCYLKSENLMRTGSVVIDCPGLFASAYDTNVALDIIENADAVWYILNGRGFGESDIDSIKQIVAAKPDAVFFSVNLSQTTERNCREQILARYAAEIKANTGLDLTVDDFHIYHALLGLSAIQAQKVKDGTLDEHSKSEILRLARYFGRGGNPELKDALEDTVLDTLPKMDGVERTRLKGLELFADDADDIAFCREKSGIDGIVSAIENEVVTKKAKSILVDNGSKKAVELIREVEGDLKVSEDLARADEFKMRGEFEAAQERLEEFSSFCEEQLDDLRVSSVDKALADDYWNEVIESSIDEVAEKSARQIAETNLNELRQELNEQIINDTFSEVVKPKAVAWADRIKSGTHSLFDDLLGRKIRKIIRETSREWEVVIQDQPILAGLPSPSPGVGTEILSTELIESVIAKAPGVSGDIVVGASVGVAVGAMIGSFVFPFIGTYLGGAIGGVVGAAIAGGVGTDNRRQQIYEGVKQSLLSGVAEPQKKSEVVAKQIKRIEALRLGIIHQFQNAYEKPMDALRKRYDDAEALFAEQSERRQSIAEANQRFRTERLAPLRKEIERFEKRIKTELTNRSLQEDDDFMRSI